jgi:hypothetical protein
VWRPDAVLTGTDRRLRLSDTLDALRRAESAAGSAQHRAADRDRVATRLAGEGVGPGRFGHAVSASSRAMAVPFPERRQCRVASR